MWTIGILTPKRERTVRRPKIPMAVVHHDARKQKLKE
jgi:hypothetical protein